jgi:hypothetical protein
MIVSATLLKDLQKRVTLLEEDLRRRCDADPQVNAPLQAQYEAARESKRTAETFNAWRDEQITQIAVAWVLACVFVRFLEDNQLLDTPFLAGPDAARMNRARDEQELFFKQHPTASERDYLLHVFDAVGQLPGMREFFDRRHNPLWLAGPTGDALAGLLDFWRKTDPDTGRLVHDFNDPAVGGNVEPLNRSTVESSKSATAAPDSTIQPGNDLTNNDPTRFLGDLYQDLSEAARKRFALLQTPVFVEEFILDRTLTPAIQTFGYKAVRMIDPTCGSGHFCLGGFHRLFRLWQQGNPGENLRVLAQRALDGVYGVDLNPYAVAIARFRLLLAALQVSGINKLKNAPDFRLHLASGDSLLHGRRFRAFETDNAYQPAFDTEDIFRDELKHHYEVEDAEALHRILGQQYHAVVGNPPYITVKDRAVSELYRARFPSCSGKYSLSVPFMERFFDLAVKGDGTPQQPAGFVGQITSNSFMKREFGKKLIQEYLPRWDLTHVVDTSYVYIPDFGTPTVILFGKNQPPCSSTLRAVFGIKGEDVAPTNASTAAVWRAIMKQTDDPGSQSEWVSVSDAPRTNFHNHPWSIGGGGAAELKEEISNSCEHRLGNWADELGISAVTGEDDLYVFPTRQDLVRQRVEKTATLATGDLVRDWQLTDLPESIWLYDDKLRLLELSSLPKTAQLLWSYRAVISQRKRFGTPMLERGLTWYEWQELYPAKLRTPLTVTWGEVSTHNHFVLDRGGKVFKQTAPVLKLKTAADEEIHVCLLGVLNSSLGCFYLKQVCHDKGGGGIGGGLATERWEHFFAFNGTNVASFPLPAHQPSQLPVALVKTSAGMQVQSPAATLASWRSPESGELREWLACARNAVAGHRRQLIAWQEELDWQIYEAFSLLEPPDGVSLPEGEAMDAIPHTGLELGERAFEIVLARRMAAGEAQTAWFERHGSTPITELPAHWPAAYRALVERRLALIARDRNIALIEQPEYKRRWNTEPWDDQQERALRQWLLNRLEGYFFEGERMFLPRPVTKERGEGRGEGSSELSENRPTSPHPSPPRRAGEGDDLTALRASWPAGQRPTLVSTNQLAELVQADAAFLKVAEVYVGAAGFSVPKLVRELVEAESVPFLPFQRYKESGLRKRQDWERTWELQREEDRLSAECGTGSAESKPAQAVTAQSAIRNPKLEIPVPPKYANADFKSSTFWRLRGKLDVPKERWVLYHGAEREGDTSPVIAWAGWNHLQQAQALAEYYITAKDTWGWTQERLTLLLAGLADLLPWLKQWHNELNPEYGMGLGDYFGGFLDEECRKNGTTAEGVERMRLGKQS